MVNGLDCLFFCQNCIAICYFTFACHHGKTLILLFVLVSFYRFIDNALFGKESTVLEKVR